MKHHKSCISSQHLVIKLHNLASESNNVVCTIKNNSRRVLLWRMLCSECFSSSSIAVIGKSSHLLLSVLLSILLLLNAAYLN